MMDKFLDDLEAKAKAALEIVGRPLMLLMSPVDRQTMISYGRAVPPAAVLELIRRYRLAVSTLEDLDCSCGDQQTHERNDHCARNVGHEIAAELAKPWPGEK